MSEMIPYTALYGRYPVPAVSYQVLTLAAIRSSKKKLDALLIKYPVTLLPIPVQ